MIEGIAPTAGTPNDFFQDERFNRFRRVQVPFGKFVLEIPDPDAVQDEGNRKALELKSKEGEDCRNLYTRAADELRNVINALKAVERDDSLTFSKMSDAQRAYRTAAGYLSYAETTIGGKIDRKA